MDDLFPTETSELLQRAMERLDLTTHYKLAQALNWPHSDMSKYRTGRITMSVERILEFAQVTGIPEKEVMAAAIKDKQRRRRNQMNGMALKTANIEKITKHFTTT